MRIALNSAQPRVNRQNIHSNEQRKQQIYSRRNPSFGTSTLQWGLSLAPFTGMLIMLGGIVVGCIRGSRKK